MNQNRSAIGFDALCEPETASPDNLRAGCLALLASGLARGIARVALGLLFGFQLGQPCGRFFLLTRELGCCGGRRFLFAALLFGLLCVARFLGLGPRRSNRLPLGPPLYHRWIIGARLGAKFIQDVLPRLLRGLLPVCEARFFEASHRKALSLRGLCLDD